MSSGWSAKGKAGLHQVGRESRGFQAKGGHDGHREEEKNVFTEASKGLRGS